MRKHKTNKESGITLIALVVTIIVLLLLAGISIQMLTGDNGILNNSEKSIIETRGAKVEEERNFWWSDIEMDKTIGTINAKELSQLLDELEDKELINANERTEIEEKGKVTIGSRTIVFKKLLLSEYANIGDYVDYQPNASSEYIVKSQYSGLNSDYTITQENFRWRIMSMDKDKVCLIADTQSNQKVDWYRTSNYFSSSSYYSGTWSYGWLNGAQILHNICFNMYSYAGIGIGRSITLEDVLSFIDEENYDLNSIMEDYKSNYDEHYYDDCSMFKQVDYVSNTIAISIRDYYSQLAWAGYKQLTPIGEDLIIGNGSFNYDLATRVYIGDGRANSYGFPRIANKTISTILGDLTYYYLSNSGIVANISTNASYRPVVELNPNMCITSKHKVNDEWKLVY